MATETQAFYSLWAQGDILDRLVANLSKSDIGAVRLANSACCNLVTRRLFQRIQVTFTPNSFTRPYRVEALARIGHHIEHLTFYMPHSEATFLPPLIHPATGAEISYLYTPHTSMASTLTRPKYGNSELGDILTQQYPPLFHSATNVPSFINAVKHLPNLRHLTIRTPGQNPAERYRRDIVDYALMSLRIAIERSSYLTKLSKLSLHGVHPAAFLYLKFQDGPGFGCSPIAGKRWRQIRKMHIAVEAWDFYGPSGPGLDQLKIIDDYLRQFTGTLEKLSFTWVGRKGPCPLALAEDPLFDTPAENKKLFNEVTSPMSPLPPAPGVRSRIHFKRLKYLQVRNASMHANQLRGLVEMHRASVKEFDFDNVVLHNGGNWDEALAPLMSGPSSSESSRDTWARYSVTGDGRSVHSVSTPRTESHPSPSLPEEAFVTSPATSRFSVAENDAVEVRHPSAAVEAAGRELLDLEVEGLEAFVGLRNSHASTSSEHTAREGSLSFDDGDSYEYTYYGDEQETIIVELDEDVDSAINLATTNNSQATLVPFSTKLKKRARKRVRKPWHPKREGNEGVTDEDGPGSSLQPIASNHSAGEKEKEKEKHSLRNLLSHKRSNSTTTPPALAPPQQPNKLQKPPPGPVTVYGPAPQNRVRQSSDPIPYAHGDNPTTYELPLVIDDDESLPTYSRATLWPTAPRPRAASDATVIPPPPNYAAPPPPGYAPPPPPTTQSTQALHRHLQEQLGSDGDIGISAPIISTDALPVLLQPNIYQPTFHHPSAAASTVSIPIVIESGSRRSSEASSMKPPTLQRYNTNSTVRTTDSKPSLQRFNTASTVRTTDSKPSLQRFNTASTVRTTDSKTSLQRLHTGDSSISMASSKPSLHRNDSHNVNSELSAVQRNLEQEEIQRHMAEDAEARSSALKRAREAVLEKLGRLSGNKALEEEELLDMHPALKDEILRELPRPSETRERSESGGSRLVRELFGAVKGKTDKEGDQKGEGNGVYQTIEGSDSVLVPLVFSRN